MKIKLVLAVAACFILSLSARADDFTPQPHVLGGHNFLPMSLIPPPFADSQTNLTLIAGSGNYPSLGFNGLDPSATLKLAAAEALLNIQYSPLTWLALSVGASVNSVTGLDTSSALAYGASIERQWNLGAIGQLIRSDNLILSVGLIVQFPHYLSISPTDIIPNFNRNLAANTPDFTNSDVNVVWKPSVRFAYAINPSIGVDAFGGFTIYQFSDNPPDQASLKGNLGVGVNVDFKPNFNFPLGLTASYSRSQVLQAGDVNSDIFAFGLWESHWTQSAFGLEVGFGDVSGLTSTIATLTTRIYY